MCRCIRFTKCSITSSLSWQSFVFSEFMTFLIQNRPKIFAVATIIVEFVWFRSAGTVYKIVHWYLKFQLAFATSLDPELYSDFRLVSRSDYHWLTVSWTTDFSTVSCFFFNIIPVLIQFLLYVSSLDWLISISCFRSAWCSRKTICYIKKAV